MELIAYIGINHLNATINYWRSKTGLEVDFVIDGKLAIEVKLTADPKPKDLKGLFAFCDDYQPNFAIVVCTCDKPRLVQHKENMQYYILPWQYFLEQLWAGKYF